MKQFVLVLLFMMLVVFGCSKDDDNSTPTGVDNNAPVIQSIYASPEEVSHEGTSSLICVATDAERDTLIYSWTTRFGDISSEGAEAEWIAPWESGTYFVKITVNDGVALDVDSVQVVVMQNRTPVITNLTSGSDEISRGRLMPVTCTATDDDDDNLSYVWTCNSGTIQGSGASVQWQASQVSGIYWIKTVVGDGYASDSDSIQVSVTPNRSPIINDLIANPMEIVHGGNSSLTCTASDADGDNLNFVWTAQSGSIQGSGSNVQWRAPQNAGTYRIGLTVSDGTDAVRDSVLLRVLANRPPIIRSLIASRVEVVHEGTSEITCTATDEDGDNLTYTWFARAGILQGSGASVRWEAPGSLGDFWISVAVNDGYDIDADSVQLTVIPPNSPPGIPFDPFPINGSYIASSPVTFTWRCVDPDGDPITYDFYFGELPPSLFQRGLQTAEFRIEDLNPEVQYWWKVIAYDNHGNTSESARWHFYINP